MTMRRVAKKLKAKLKNLIDAGRVHGALKRGSAVGSDANDVASIVSSLKGKDETPWYLLPPPAQASLWVRTRFEIACLVHSKWFTGFFMVLIILNTVALAIEYHDMPDKMTQALHIANIVFTSLFGLEVVLKVIGLSIFEYISDGFNWFDLLIVIASIIELVISTGSSLTSLRAFRAVRVIRVLRLVRFLKVFKSLNKITSVVGSVRLRPPCDQTLPRCPKPLEPAQVDCAHCIC